MLRYSYSSRPNVFSTALFGDHKTRGSDWLCSVTLLILKTRQNRDKTKLHKMRRWTWEAVNIQRLCCVVKGKRLSLYYQSGSDCRCTYCWSQQELQCNALLSKAITRQSKRTAWKTDNLIVETPKAHIIQSNAGCQSLANRLHPGILLGHYDEWQGIGKKDAIAEVFMGTFEPSCW